MVAVSLRHRDPHAVRPSHPPLGVSTHNPPSDTINYGRLAGLKLTRVTKLDPSRLLSRTGHSWVTQIPSEDRGLSLPGGTSPSLCWIISKW